VTEVGLDGAGLRDNAVEPQMIVIASGAKQSRATYEALDCLVAALLAMMGKLTT
jgi:hypothetical protein